MDFKSLYTKKCVRIFFMLEQKYTSPHSKVTFVACATMYYIKASHIKVWFHFQLLWNCPSIFPRRGRPSSKHRVTIRTFFKYPLAGINPFWSTAIFHCIHSDKRHTLTRLAINFSNKTVFHSFCTSSPPSSHTSREWELQTWPNSGA